MKNKPLTPDEETRMLALEDKNSNHKCSEVELNELQELLDRHYGQ